MKCYFALSDDVSNNDVYYWMFVATLNSAKKNTKLDLHCLFDFRKTNVENIEDDRIFQLLKKYEVNIHLVTIDFEDYLLKVYTDEYLKKCNVTKSSLYSRFLRFMIPDVEKDDEYVLYADTDVLFLKEITLEDFSFLPKTVSVCPEFENSYNYTNFNAGIMLINIASYKSAKMELCNLLKNEIRAKIECCDQGYLNELYQDNFEKLPNIYNWKPYWGINDDAIIVHLHGLKPRVDFSDVECRFIPFVSQLMYENPDAKYGWFYYFNLFATYTGMKEMNPIVLTNLAITMECQIPHYFSFKSRFIRKLGKILGIKKNYI